MPGLYDITLDYCALADQNSEAYKFMKIFYANLSPELWKALLNILRECPYTEAFKFEELFDAKNMTMTANVRKFFGRNEFKIVSRVFDSRNRTVFQISFYL
jgi:hypothetical protein